MITVDVDQPELDLAALVKAVEEQGETAQFVRRGLPVAEMRPLGAARRGLPLPHPILSQITFLADPMDPLDEDDWPEEAR